MKRFWRGRITSLILAGLALTFAIAWPTGSVFSQTQGYKVDWTLANPPTEGRTGLRLSLANLELTNSGTTNWASSGANALKLGYHWFTADNKAIDPKNPDNGYDELQAELPQDIPTGGRVLYPQFLVGVPSAAGDYVLHIDLVQGADGWLSTKGAADLSFKVSIRGKDGSAPTSSVVSLPLFTTSASFGVSWSGKDEDGGSGLASYDIQYKAATDPDWHDWLLGTTATTATFNGQEGQLYLFRSRATDQAGNVGKYSDNEQASTRIDSLPPSATIQTLPAQSPEVFVVRWSSFDNVAGAATALCDVQYRVGTTGDWQDWQLGTSTGSALFQGQAGQTYSFRVRATDYAGNQGDFPSNAQATTTVSAALDTLFGQMPLVAPLVGGTTSISPTNSTTPTATASISSTVAATTTTSTPPAPTGPTSQFFPLAVKNGDNGSGTTTILVHNPGTDPIDVFIRFNSFAGAPISNTVSDKLTPVSNDQATALARVDTVLKTVAPGDTINVWAGGLTPSTYNGWVEVRSLGTFQASAVRQPTTGAPLQYAPVPAATTLYLPYVKKADAVSSSIFNIANTTATPAQYTITYYDSASGNVVGTDKRTLPRYGSTRFSVNSLTTDDPNLRFQASAVITANVALSVQVENVLQDGSPLSYPALTTAASVAPQMPIYQAVDGVTTSLLVQNTTKDPLTVKMEYLDNTGQVVATTQQNLPGFGRATAWAGDVKELKAGFTGTVRVSTDAANGALAVTVLGAGPNLAGQPFLK